MKDITKILIPNRGEIVCRILRSLNSMNIPSVIIYHAVDIDSPVVQMAREKVEIHGDTPVSAYLDVEQIIKACKETGSDAVHPGFGFLAENTTYLDFNIFNCRNQIIHRMITLDLLSSFGYL